MKNKFKFLFFILCFQYISTADLYNLFQIDLFNDNNDIEQNIETSTNAPSKKENNSVFSDMFTYLLDNFQVPGTKWCGRGNLSTSLNDLGTDTLTDTCCRDHDLCPQSINAKEHKYGLFNDGAYYRSHCDCDEKFYRCLKLASHMISEITGEFYFTVLGAPCFKVDFPIIDCMVREQGRCVKYYHDTTRIPVYQWFDNPVF